MKPEKWAVRKDPDFRGVWHLIPPDGKIYAWAHSPKTNMGGRVTACFMSQKLAIRGLSRELDARERDGRWT